MFELAGLGITIYLIFCTICLLFLVGFLSEVKNGYTPAFWTFLVFVIASFILFSNLRPFLWYVPYYLAVASVWFFLKWFLFLLQGRKTIQDFYKSPKRVERAKIDGWGVVLDAKEACYATYTLDKENSSIKWTLKHPEFFFLLSHALLFPASILEEVFGNFFKRVYDMTKALMDKIAKMLIPKEAK